MWRPVVRWVVVYLALAGVALWVLPASGATPPSLTVTTSMPVASGAIIHVTGADYLLQDEPTPAWFYVDDAPTSFAQLFSNTGDIEGDLELPALANGPHVLLACRAVDDVLPCPEEDAARATIQVGTLPSLTSMAPDPSTPGSAPTVTGIGFAPSHQIGLFVDGVAGSPLATLTSTGEGAITGALPLPASIPVGGHVLAACRVDGAVGSPCFGGVPGLHVAQREFTVIAPPPPPPEETTTTTTTVAVTTTTLPATTTSTTAVAVTTTVPPTTVPTTVARTVRRTTTTTAPSTTPSSSTSSSTTLLAAASPSPTTTSGPTTSGPTTTAPRPATEITSYEPTSHARFVVELEIAAFTILAMIGLHPGVAGRGGLATIGDGGNPDDPEPTEPDPDPAPGDGPHGGPAGFGGGPGSGPGGPDRPELELGALGGVGIALSTALGGSELSDVDVDEAALVSKGTGPGDRSRTWRAPGTAAVDRFTRRGPRRTARTSPLVARVLVDAAYLRAMFGSLATLLPLAGVVLGALAAHDVSGRALPPALGFVVVLPVLGVFDALAGFLGVSAYLVGVVASGGADSADSVRLLLGFTAICFAAPLIAGAARPLRRPPARTREQRWDHLADVVIGSLMGAWAVQKMVQALPGLAGRELDVAAHADLIALVVLGGLVVRMLAESAASNWYPQRLRIVRPKQLLPAPPPQRFTVVIVRTAIFLFVAVAFLGPCWQLFVGGALFAAPQLGKLVQPHLPASPRLHRRLPRGIVKVVLMLIVGAVVAALYFHSHQSDEQIIRNAFVVLAVPGLVLAGMGLIGRKGQRRTLGWADRYAGVGILALGLFLVLRG